MNKTKFFCISVFLCCFFAFGTLTYADGFDTVTNTGETYPVIEDFAQNIDIPFQEGTLNPDASMEVQFPSDLIPFDTIPEVILGTDDRTKINTTTQAPYSQIVYIVSTFPNGLEYLGTGSMVSPDSVLTAGHVVYRGSRGGWATKVVVYPGQNGSNAPYGNASGRTLLSVSGWIENESYQHDIGMIKLDHSIGNVTGWFGLSTSVSDGMPVTITGYPGELEKRTTMWTHSGPLTSVDQNNLYYTIDTTGGQSGSPVYNNQKQIVAVHAYGDPARDQNLGTRIHTAYNWIASELIYSLPVYRLYNRNSGSHFYTTSEGEVLNLERAGWLREGVSWFSPTTGIDVYRLYNPNSGGHFFTTNAAERNNLVNAGWNYEGVSWKASQGQDQKTPVYRVYNPNSTRGSFHLYTTSITERDVLVRIGWRYEGIAWYAL